MIQGSLYEPGTRAVVILSGGMDSSVLLYKAVVDLRSRQFVRALSFNYGQRHVRELAAAETIAHKAGVRHQIVDVSALRELLGTSALTSSKIDVPHGHYEAESMKSTVVPNRNAIMLSIAVGYAASIKFDYVGYAAHSGDHAIYPDCRPEFVDALDQAAQFAGGAKRVELWAPFLLVKKSDIVTLGAKLNVPFHETWSCYEGGATHCGACGTCTERREAFELAGYSDPTQYRLTPTL